MADEENKPQSMQDIFQNANSSNEDDIINNGDFEADAPEPDSPAEGGAGEAQPSSVPASTTDGGQGAPESPVMVTAGARNSTITPLGADADLFQFNPETNVLEPIDKRELLNRIRETGTLQLFVYCPVRDSIVPGHHFMAPESPIRGAMAKTNVKIQAYRPIATLKNFDQWVIMTHSQREKLLQQQKADQGEDQNAAADGVNPGVEMPDSDDEHSPEYLQQGQQAGGQKEAVPMEWEMIERAIDFSAHAVRYAAQKAFSALTYLTKNGAVVVGVAGKLAMEMGRSIFNGINSWADQRYRQLSEKASRKVAAVESEPPIMASMTPNVDPHQELPEMTDHRYAGHEVDGPSTAAYSFNEPGETRFASAGVNLDAVSQRIEAMADNQRQASESGWEKIDNAKSTLGEHMGAIAAAVGVTSATQSEQVRDALANLDSETRENVTQRTKAMLDDLRLMAMDFRQWVSDPKSDFQKVDSRGQQEMTEAMVELTDPAKEKSPLNQYKNLLDNINQGNKSLGQSIGVMFSGISRMLSNLGRSLGLKNAYINGAGQQLTMDNDAYQQSPS